MLDFANTIVKVWLRSILHYQVANHFRQIFKLSKTTLFCNNKL